MLKNELVILAIASWIIIIILSILFCYLVMRKAYENIKRKKIDQQKSLFSGPVLSYLLTGVLSRIFVPNTTNKRNALEELLSQFTEIIEGDREINNLFVLAENHFTQYYKKSLKARSWSIRMNALYHIEDFQIKSLSNDVYQLIQSDRATQEEIVFGLRILSMFNYRQLFNELVVIHANLTEYQYRTIIYYANEKLLDVLLLGFYQCPPPLQYAILELLSIKKELKFVPFIETVFRINKGELRIKALKALSSIGYVKNIREYLPLCESPSWQERMMLAKLLTIHYSEDSIQCLTKLLHDSSWWVRSQAGMVLKHYPNGTNLLRKVYETSTDSFAKDMAMEWMNKGD